MLPKDVEQRYEKVRAFIKDWLRQAQEALVGRKQLEAELGRVEAWVTETEGVLALPVILDCSSEQLRERSKKYQVYNNGGLQLAKLICGFVNVAGLFVCTGFVVYWCSVMFNQYKNHINICQIYY